MVERQHMGPDRTVQAGRDLMKPNGVPAGGEQPLLGEGAKSGLKCMVGIRI